ncbi:hypothetical protein KUCAC02_017907, partial [Chaenocephalus aceratus]
PPQLQKEAAAGRRVKCERKRCQPSGLPYFAMTLPLSHDRTRGGNQMTGISAFTWSQSSGCERKLCPQKPFIASG